MGLYIHLSVNLKGISNAEWESAWLESLDIFKKFPLPLSRHIIETKDGIKRHVYSQNLIRNKDEKNECWYLEGDLLSGQTAETFVLYRHLDAYKADYSTHQGCFKDSVFKTNEPEYPSSSNGIELWDSKTQGYPFHLAILAVGIMLENRFPDNCYLHGDIEEKQVAVMLEWLETVYGKTYQQPICFDADRLFGQLNAVYKTKKALMDRFTCLYQGDRTDEFKAFMHFRGKKETYDYYGKNLNDFKSLNQWGAQDIMRTVLEATENVYELVTFVENAMAKRAKSKEAFEWTHVLEMLCGDYIFVNPIERESMKRLTNRSDNMDNIEDVFGRLFMKMSGMPHVSPLYVPEDELLEIFALRDPKHGDKYRKIIEDYQKKLKDQISKVDETMETIDEAIEKDTHFQAEATEKEDIVEKYPAHEQYIITQAIRQQDRFGNYKTNVGNMSQSLQKLMEKYADMYDKKTVEAYRKGIYEYSFHAGFGVSEKGWATIDKLTDLNTLKYLFVLATVNNNEMSFWRWRKHIFETPETWQYLKAPKAEKSVSKGDDN
jgi:hypothetical protein